MLLCFTQDGTASMSKLGERLMIHPTSVTSLVDRLERAGHVTREPNPDDRRGILARITPQGRQVADNATARLVEAEFGLSGLSSAEGRQLVALIRKARVAAGDLAAS
jgi:DNA-binding MarR family transcriptional regulator